MKTMLEEVLSEDGKHLPKKSLLSFSAEELSISLNAGDTIVDNFQIIYDGNENLEGEVYSTDLRMQITTDKIEGRTRTIYYQYSGIGLKEGEELNGEVTVVSTLGEYTLPYKVTVYKDSLSSSIGPIRNLFLFANLAKSDFNEAVNLFYQKSFGDIFSGADAHYKLVYEGLAAGEHSPRNVETFLQLTKKKDPVKFLADLAHIECPAPKETEKQYLGLVKDGWGYSGFVIRTEGDFLALTEEDYTVDHFGEANTLKIPYFIEPSALRSGRNEGAIIIDNFFHQLRIPVTVYGEEELRKDNKAITAFDAKLTRQFIEFGLGKMSKTQWLRESRELLARARHLSTDSVLYLLYDAQLLLSEKKYEYAEDVLDRVYILLQTGEEPDLFHAYYYYLAAQSVKDQSVYMDYASRIEDYYKKNQNNWRFGYMLLRTSNIYLENEERRYQFIKELYRNGATAPILYMEALALMNKKPAFITEIGSFELSVLGFAYKHQVLPKELRSRLVFLSQDVKVYSERLFKLLSGCYGLEKKDDTLAAICTLLMKGNKIGNEYFIWFARGVEQELRINGLYEYYMLSIDLAYEGKLPKLILMYFAYRNNLDYDRSAFLYANILKHGREYKEIYEDYLPIIETFAREQLLKRRISDNLAFIYEQFASRLLTEPEFASAYAELIFTYEITIKDSSINAVVVRYAHLKEEIITPVFRPTVYVNITGAATEIFLEDAEGNRYIDESLYTKRRMIPDLRYEYLALMNANLDIMTSLYRAEEAIDQSGVTNYNVSSLNFLVHSKEVTDEFRYELIMMLIRYYFEKDECENIDELMLLLRPEELSGIDYETCIHILIARGFYEEAYRYIEDYGLEQVGDRLLLRLFDRMLPRRDYDYDRVLLSIAQTLFARGKYDARILTYLLKYDTGTTPHLKNLWRAADAFELDTRELLERMLVQILYTGVSIDDEESIYLAYCEKGTREEIDLAFLTRLSYLYFSKGENIKEKVFDRVTYYAKQGEEISDECKLAFLKHAEAVLSRRERLFDVEKKLITKFVGELLGRGIKMPMFLAFSDFVPGLTLMQDRTYIEYHGKPDSRVILHYVLEKNGEEDKEYKKEEMERVYEGIYIHSFVLFEGEKVSYYITEENGRQESLTRSDVLAVGEKELTHASPRFKMLNSMMEARSKQDDVAYVKLTENYMQKSFVAERLFTVI